MVVRIDHRGSEAKQVMEATVLRFEFDFYLARADLSQEQSAEKGAQGPKGTVGADEGGNLTDWRHGPIQRQAGMPTQFERLSRAAPGNDSCLGIRRGDE